MELPLAPCRRAPEQWNTANVGKPCDIWAAGATLLHVITGEIPFAGMQMQQIMVMVRGCPTDSGSGAGMTFHCSQQHH